MLIKYYHDEDKFNEAFCRLSECDECERTDCNGEPNNYGCDDFETWVGDENHIMCDSGIHEEWTPHYLAEKMLIELVYFVMRVRAGTIRSKTTYNRYVETIEKITEKSIDDVIKYYKQTIVIEP